MNKQDVLLEIGLEEMPARFMPESTKQLGEKVKAWFETQNISFEETALFNSPRRLAVLVKGVAEKQEDIKEEAKGPAKRLPKMLKAIGQKQLKALPEDKVLQQMISISKRLKEWIMSMSKNFKKERGSKTFCQR